MINPATAATLELVEAVPDDDYERIREIGVVKPNRIRINGQPVLVPIDSPIEVSTGRFGAVTARLSLLLSSLTVGFETTGPLTEEEKALRADLRKQILTGRSLHIENGEPVPLAEPERIWEGRAYTRDDLQRLRDEIDALLTDGGARS